MRKNLFLIVLTIAFCTARAQKLVLATETRNSSIRAVSVIDSSTIWISGSNGWFATSSDGGQHWTWKQLERYKALDFRGLWAFSAKRAILMSSGTPAIILRTEDGGENWKEVYRNESPEVFFDGISFWNEREGLVYGDPIKGNLQLLGTKNGGRSWRDVSKQLLSPLVEGEASFAASNTGICTLGNKTWIISGGTKSRIFYSSDKGRSWTATPIPVIQGRNTAGAFSVSFIDESNGVIAGGDYKADTLSEKNLFYTSDGGKSWIAPAVGPRGYKSCVCWVTEKILVATGTSGTDISSDGGNSWTPLTEEGFNVVKALKGTRRIILAGANGRIATIDL